jgi:cytidyltransferase-related domain
LKKNKKIKIGILGGSFDPPHKGHVKISTEAKRNLKLQNYLG